LQCARLEKKDRPESDPFAIQDAETLIEAIHREHGEAQGNYDEFRFFTAPQRWRETLSHVSSNAHHHGSGPQQLGAT